MVVTEGPGHVEVLPQLISIQRSDEAAEEAAEDDCASSFDVSSELGL